MIIVFSPDLTRQDIFANGVELCSIMGKDRLNGKRVFTFPPEKKVYVHTFRNPVLVTDTWRIAKLSAPLRETLFSLYTQKPRIISYDGVSTFWDHTHLNVWCPSIDTLLFAKALRNVFRKRKQFRTGAELGCGSGFLSKYVLAKSKVQSFLVNDLNPYAIKCAMDNIKDSRASFYAGDGFPKIKHAKFDLLICNPPYVPRPSSIDDNPYEGVKLLNHLVHHGQDYLNENGVMVINISSLCWDVVMKKKPVMKMTLLEKMTVPLKVNNILNNKRWLKYLEKHNLKKQHKQGYEYWQTINIVLLEKRSA
ncbi:MAG: methyltransferase [archaeon]